MIECSCARCGRVHFSDEIHVGKFLRCAGCGDAVSIGLRSGRVNSASAQITAASQSRPEATQVGRTESSSPAIRKKRFKLAWPIVFVGMMAVTIVCVVLTLNLHSREIADDKRVQDSLAEKAKDSPQEKPLEQASPDISDRVATEPVHSSLPNGTRCMRDKAIQGHGELTIINGTKDDAVANFVGAENGRLYRCVYIDAGSSFTLRNLYQGTYDVIFSTGRDWTGDRFTQDAFYQKFGKSLSFNEEPIKGGKRFTTYKITLNPVPEGTVRPIDVSEEQFASVFSQRTLP